MVPTFYYQENHGVLLERLYYLISNLQKSKYPMTIKEKIKVFIVVAKILAAMATFTVTCMSEYEKFVELTKDEK